MADQQLPEARLQNGVTIFTFGESLESIDDPVIQHISGYLVEQARNITNPRIVFDMTRVKFFSSSFIELLFRVSNRLTSRGGDFAICGLSPYCLEILHVTNLDQLWKIFPDLQRAVAELTSTQKSE